MCKPGIRKIASVHGIAIKYMFFSGEFLNALRVYKRKKHSVSAVLSCSGTQD